MMNEKRAAGLLMPVSALPAPYGIGTLGAGAYRFVDWLARSGMKVWQVLPLLPTNYGDSPYQSCASNALNYYFIDFDFLAEDGLLNRSEYASVDWGTDPNRVDYGKLFLYKIGVLRIAFSRFDRASEAWKKFLVKGEYADFAVFMSLKSRHSHRPWTEWKEPYRTYDEGIIRGYIAENRDDVEFWQFTQYIFLKQWTDLKAYAHENGVEIMGDMPIYVAADSVEMWKYRDSLFLLDEAGNSSLVAGVPPDAFSDDGQLWGNPVYDWEKLREDGYRWWHERIGYAFRFFDILRIDHFRGFDRFYAISAGSENARCGVWLDGPRAELFKGRENLRIVAEDLGVIDDGVRELMRKTGYPGMKVMEFAFDGNPWNEHKPSNYTENCVAYTGTHDNEPLCAYIGGMTRDEKRRFDADLERECLNAGLPLPDDTVYGSCKVAVRLLFASRANLAIVPMQDVLCLGAEARINEPSTVSSRNWSYRFNETDFSEMTGEWLRLLLKETKRY